MNLVKRLIVMLTINQKSPSVKQNSHLNFSKKRLVEFFKSCKPWERKLFAAQIDLDNKFESVFPSQRNLAVKAGVTREAVCRKIDFFEKLGFEETRQYRFGQTLRYYINPIFHDREFRLELAQIPEFQQCFNAPTVWWLRSPHPIFLKNRNVDKENLITPINKSSFIRNIIIKSECHSAVESRRIQLEKHIAMLSPQEKAKLDELRQQRYHKNHEISGFRPHLSGVQTLEDVFKGYGFFNDGTHEYA